MTEEADARARLLAHYQDRLVLLARRLIVAEAEFAAAEQGQRPAVKLKMMVTRIEREIASTNEKVRRLREAIGPE